MQKSREDTPIRSSKDSFCSGRDIDYRKLYDKMEDLVEHLNEKGYKVYRKKIEKIILDVRYD